MTPERSDNTTRGRCRCLIILAPDIDAAVGCDGTQEPDSPFCAGCATRHPKLDEHLGYVTVSRHSGVRSIGHQTRR